MRFLVTEKLGPHKFKTPEGYLICTDAILSRTGKQEYKRCEIFGDACDEPDKIVNVDRVDAEVFSDKAMASFENKPICIEHPDHDVNAENHNELSVGFIRDIHKGEDNGHPVMMGTLVITDKDAVEAVESGEYKELSCGYDCDIDDDGEPCQRNIRGNHVALCKHGRAGIARIVDSNTTMVEASTLSIGNKVNFRGRKYTVVSVKKNAMYNGEVDITLKEDNGSKRVIEAGERDKFVLIDSKINDEKYKIEDEGMKDIQSTKAPGTDKIIYVMQSDIDKNLYFYIGKTFSMKEGAWGYTKFEMGNTTPEQLKAELSKNGWHQVASGPARIIDASNEEWTVVEEENYEKANKAVIDEEYVQLPRGRFKVVEKTKEELEREGYGYHHSANGYSVYVKNNHAVAIKDSINDAKTEYIFNWHDTYHGTKDKTRVDANSIKEAIKKFGDIIALGGVGTANCYVISISPNDGYMRAYGKLSDLLRTFKDCDMKDETEKNFKIYVKNVFGAYKVADWPAVSKEAAVKEFLEANPSYRNKGIIEARDSVSDSKKEQLFTIEYEQDGVTYVRKVRANSIEDAIKKVRDSYDWGDTDANAFEKVCESIGLKTHAYLPSNKSMQITVQENRDNYVQGVKKLRQLGYKEVDNGLWGTSFRVTK